MEPKIIHEDKYLFVCQKPAKYPVQSDRSNDTDLKTYLEHYMRETKGFEEPYVGIVHRLDRPVGGLVVVAKNPKSNAFLSKGLQERSFKKIYLAVVEGQPDAVTLVDYLKKRSKDNTSHIVEEGTPKAKKAILHLKPIKSLSIDGIIHTMIQIELETGRHHQIRVQLAHAGYPIWGDTKYNPSFQQKRGWFDIALFASALSFVHPNGEFVQFKIEPDHEIFKLFEAH